MLPDTPVSRWLLVFALLAAPAWADADLPDAGLPDASVGGTGAERASEEEEDATTNPCLDDGDCDRGFQCLNAACTYRPYRDAEFSFCGTAPALPLLLLALAAFRRARR